MQAAAFTTCAKPLAMVLHKLNQQFCGRLILLPTSSALGVGSESVIHFPQVLFAKLPKDCIEVTQQLYPDCSDQQYEATVLFTSCVILCDRAVLCH